MANNGASQPLLSDAGNSYLNLAKIRYPEEKAIGSLTWLDSLFEKQNYSSKKVLIVLAIYLGGGTLCFFLIMDQIQGKKTNGILDSIYFCVVTMTTVGYGDLVPHTILAKLLSCVYVFTGMAVGGMILSKAADYLLEKQEIHLVRAIHLKEKIGSFELLKKAEKHKIKYKFLMSTAFLSVLIVLGTVCLYHIENLALIDAFYCVCSTITTLGYGDNSFSTRTGRIFAVFWILSSTVCLAQFFLYLAELYTEKRQSLFVKRVLMRNVTSSDLEAADIDHDKIVTAAEFVVYTLKEMGKISQKDISLVMERFNTLDVDHSGTLTESDLMPSQASQAHAT